MKLFNFKKKRSSIILFNGFSSSTNDFVSLNPYLNHFNIVKLVHFPSDIDENGRKVDTRYDVWLDNTYKKLKEIKDESDFLVIVGFSSGSILACYFAELLKVDRLVLISPMFNYQDFTKGVEKTVSSIRTNIVNRFNPIHTVKSFSNIGRFLKNPIKNWKYLAKVNLTPLTKPQTVLLFPLFSIFEEELGKVDHAIAKLSKWAVERRNIDDVNFGESQEPESVKEEKSNKKLVSKISKQLNKIIPEEFKNLTSQNVVNILKLLAFCDKNFTKIECPTLIYLALHDEATKEIDISKLTERIKHPSCTIISYPIDDHNLFGSVKSKEVCENIIEFTKIPKKRWLNKKKQQEED
jgi:esterase/lipase